MNTPLDPPPLPPGLPLAPADLAGLERAARALGHLAATHAALPTALAEALAGHLVWAEAIDSSRLAGVPLTLREVLAHEGGAPTPATVTDLRAVARYASALEHGLGRVRTGAAVDLRLMRDLHEVLLLRRDGGGRMPGLLRSSQIGVGGRSPEASPFVPPPPTGLRQHLDALATFLADAPHPALVTAALAHAQFETIHPFLDGNGRVGRMLLPMVLAAEGALAALVLPISHALADDPGAYEAALQRIRTDDDWAGWLRFFWTAVEAEATRAATMLTRARERTAADAATADGLGRGAASARTVLADLVRHPITTIPAATARLDLTYPTVQAALGRLEAAGIVYEVTGGARGRVFAYGGVLEALGAEG